MSETTVTYKKKSQGPEIWRRFKKNRRALLGLGILIFLVFLAVNLSVLGLARKGVKIGRRAVPVSAVGAVSSAVMLFTFSLEIAVISAVIIAIGVAAYLILTRTEKD